MMLEKKRVDWAAEIGILIFFLAALSIAYNEYFEVASYFLPSYDNPMLHAGRARVIIETGHYAENEVVFGGLTKTYHVPFYPALVAGTSMLSGLDWAWSERLIGLMIAIILPFSFYCLAKGLFDWRAGVAAALIALYTPVLMHWATRNSPISVGNFLVPIGLYFILKRRPFLAALCAVALALDHQPSLMVFLLSALIFTVFDFVRLCFEKDYLSGLPEQAVKVATGAFIDMFPSIAAGLSGFAAYIIWHIRQTGSSCLDFACLPQRAAHEFGARVPLIDYFSKVPQLFALGGVVAYPFYPKVPLSAKLLGFAYLIASILLTKNEWFGIATFTERFATYLGGAAAIFGGIAFGSLLALASGEWGAKEKTQQPSN